MVDKKPDVLTKLKKARDLIAEVYNIEALDDIPDNGNLILLNEIILKINDKISKLS